MIDCSVIVVSYNTRDLLRECLVSIYRETKDTKFEVFVVDNRSEDGSADMVHEEFPEVHLIRNDENVGFARGNNIAIKEAVGRYLLLLNPDTRLVNNAVGVLVDYMDNHPEAGAAGSKLLDEDQEVQTVCRKFSRIIHEVGELLPILNRYRWRWLSRNYLPEEFDYEVVGETDYVQGACLMVRREIEEKIGPLDERFFMYSEEEDWCYRIKRGGWKVMYVPSAAIVHYHGQSSKQRPKEMLKELYRSKLKFFHKNYGWLTARLLWLNLVAIMFIRIPYYSLMPLVSSNRGEDARKHRDQSLTILSAMISSQ